MVTNKSLLLFFIATNLSFSGAEPTTVSSPEIMLQEIESATKKNSPETTQASTEERSWYIFTGGPGTGKSSVIAELASRGYQTVQEAATIVIADELKKGEKTPWSENWFEGKLATIMEIAQNNLPQNNLQPVFFDRSPLDPLVYIALYEKKSPTETISKLKNLLSSGKFNPKVFLFNDLGFCKNTAIRHEDVAEMLRIENAMVQHYTLHGFEIIRVPAGTIKDRTDFILSHIKTK
ncbi:hypothetical protein FJ366_02235 [Candidatus Dependentiae bacterium]|nr:hypothetical protein [Candidatus Dependentiae bacterium]